MVYDLFLANTRSCCDEFYTYELLQQEEKPWMITTSFDVSMPVIQNRVSHRENLKGRYLVASTENMVSC